MPTELGTATFTSPDHAEAALEQLRGLDAEDIITLVDAVIIDKNADGTIKVHETDEVQGPQGRNFGAVVGAMIGLFGGPLGAVVGAAAGAAVGNVTANILDSGIENKRIQEVLQGLPNGGSAVIALFRHDGSDRTLTALKALGRDVRRFAVSVSTEETNSGLTGLPPVPPPMPQQ